MHERGQDDPSRPDSFAVSVRDETTSGERVNDLLLSLESERITVRELIRARVYQEVREHNAGSRPTFRGLVRPTDAERELNGYSLRKRSRTVDWKRQAEVALGAFERGHVLILVDDSQVERLDEQVELRPGSTVSFLRLVPLTGG